MNIDFKNFSAYNKEFKRSKIEHNFVYAIHIDIEKKREHIIVGEELEVLRAIHGDEADVLYNKFTQLGSFFFTFPTNISDEWQEFTKAIIKGYGAVTYPQNMQKKMGFLENKFKSKHPVQMFVATQTLFQIVHCYHSSNASNNIRERTSYLYKYFLTDEKLFLWEEYENQKNQLDDKYSKSENDMKMCVVENKEYILIYKSFKPLIDIYLKKLSEKNLTFKECNICGAKFMATHKHNKFCSDKCKQVQVLKNRESFKESNKEVAYAGQYKTSYTFWYNRIKELRKKFSDNAKQDLLLEAENAFSSFKKKSKEFKIAVKNEKVEIDEFIKFLKTQEIWIDRFYEKWKK